MRNRWAWFPQGSINEGQGAWGGTAFGASLANLLGLKNPKCTPSSHIGRTLWKDLLDKGAGFGRPPRTLFGTSQIIIHRCQRQLQISHVRPEVFIQEPSDFGFDQKPQIGVNISLASFYDIYILHVSSGSHDSKAFSRHLLLSHPHLSLQVEKQLKGRESDI